MTVDREAMPGMRKLGLSKHDVADIVNVCLQSMMMDAAIAYSVPLNKADKEFFTFNGYEGSYTLSDSSKNIFKAFLPAKANGFNKRVEYVEKVLKDIKPDCTRETVIKFLESLWNLMIKMEIIVSEGIAYKVNTKKVKINTHARFCQCTSCRKITPYNIRNICPSYKCTGKLIEIDPEVVFKNNHYYRVYQDLEIRDLRVVEHTAQLNREKAYAYQNEFKAKKIDVLEEIEALKK